MKKIAFITIHVGSNFGSVLQTIATSVTLKNMSYDPICVNYVPPRVTNKRFWDFGKRCLFKKILLFFWKLYAWPLRIINKKVYQGYLGKYCNLSAPIYSEDDFVNKCPHADVYMTGSDQVWNMKHNEGLDTHYFFDGVKGKKISFASSVGYTEMIDDSKESFKQYLADYSSLSVREDSAVKLLASLGLKAEQLLDPVFILSETEWKDYTKPERIVKEPYLLVYAPYNTVDKGLIYRHARRIADKEGLKVVSFSWTYYKDKDADISMRFAGPADFLNLMMNADYVITNSFHGTAFSICLKKRFWVFLPSGFTTRITSVLIRFRLNSRLIENEAPEEWDYDEGIDTTYIDEVLNEERARSFNYLRKAIG